MPIPYHRYVRDTGEGCGINECLNCKATWEWRGGSGVVRFCMYCGVEFCGELQCRDHAMPRWLYEARRRLGDEAAWRLERCWWSRSRSPERYWVLEERSFWLRDGGNELLQDWHTLRPLVPDRSAHEAYKALLTARAEVADCGDPVDSADSAALDLIPHSFCRYEHRVRRLTFACQQ